MYYTSVVLMQNPFLQICFTLFAESACALALFFAFLVEKDYAPFISALKDGGFWLSFTKTRGINGKVFFNAS